MLKNDKEIKISVKELQSIIAEKPEDVTFENARKLAELMIKDRAITIKEACEILGTTRQTFWRRRKEGDLKFSKVPGDSSKIWLSEILLNKYKMDSLEEVFSEYSEIA